MSGQYGEPDWANPSASPAATSEAGATTSWNAGEDFSGTGANVNIGGSANAGPGKANCIQRLFSLWDICLSALMCCLGVFGIIDNPTSLPEIFVSVYMILFATLLFLFELMWWKSIDSVNKNLRMNFGFLYGIKGKAAYLIFVAFLAIGLRDDVSVKFLRWMTGGCFLGTGILLLFLHFTKPELLSSYKAPTAGFGGQRGGDVNTSV
ncbi:predicted protein [Thalassiosira pseudonana CCMP1335]|uniref:Transmembrane protein n=1 Tax=Thalassiosira pseudonana TaxID=35128 RepID=B5YNL0_THAPS|nr:predicted protein [Thalassiosira pseudonana CCMP1335]ACI65006.1 predicted protein [Thalassiosira pseudonana CCMP1335]|eukprot:g6448.t1 g6448   contig23:486739-487706(+)